jgi:DegV family protein with EDD domain
MTIRIVTDSAGDITREEANALGIRVVPLTIRFGDDEYTDWSELSVDQFYELMNQRDELPETAAPAPGAFNQAFSDLETDGATGICCINLSADLSATMLSARTAAAVFDGAIPVNVIDSKSITRGLGSIVLEAAEAAAAGASPEDLTELVENRSARTHVFGVLDTLDNLRKGGRIGGAQAFLGSVLSIKPIIDISTGSVEEAGRHHHPWGMAEENHPIHLCRGLKMPLAELWPQLKHWN